VLVVVLPGVSKKKKDDLLVSLRLGALEGALTAPDIEFWQNAFEVSTRINNEALIRKFILAPLADQVGCLSVVQ